MARVVQRRSNPPYLLIIFVFLFLISTALAVMFYISQDKAAKKVAELNQNLSDYYASGDSATVQQAKAHPFRPDSSVINTLNEEVTELSGIINVDPKTYQAAKQAADHAYLSTSNAGNRIGLAALAEQLYDKAQKESTRAGDELKLKNAGLDKAKALEAEKKDLESQYAAKYGEINKQLIAVQDTAKKDFDKYQNDLKAKDAEAAGKVEEKEKKINELDAEKIKLLATIAEKQKFIDENIKKTTQVLPTGVPTVAGKIVKVVESDKICYIDIGSDARVNIGMTFGVYPATEGVGENNKKADLKVTNVYSGTAQCAISGDSPRNPVGVNDVIANIAYDKARNFTFVVDGVFDLNGTGAATPEGAEMAKDLIKRAGGVVADKMDLRTDYVVLGEAPNKPIKPTDSADLTAAAVYAKQMKAYQQYLDTEKQAKELKLPVLNTNRFIAYVGYTPAKK